MDQNGFHTLMVDLSKRKLNTAHNSSRPLGLSSFTTMHKDKDDFRTKATKDRQKLTTQTTAKTTTTSGQRPRQP